jgi:hypothetical protein
MFAEHEALYATERKPRTGLLREMLDAENAISALLAGCKFHEFQKIEGSETSWSGTWK